MGRSQGYVRCQGFRRARFVLAAAVTLWLLALSARASAAVPTDEIPVNAFAFAGPDVGLAVGEDGLVLETTDGGRSWRPLPRGSAEHLLAVTMTDQRTAYAVGGTGLDADGPGHGVILKTVSRGTAWRRIGDPSARCWGVTVRGDRVAVWCDPCPDAPTGLLFSPDAGETWRTVGGRLSQPILAVRWAGDDGGDVLGADGTAWRWKDGTLSPLADRISPGPAVAAHFVSPESWLLALESGAVANTRDGGRSWKTAKLPGPAAMFAPRHFSFYSATEGRLAGVGPRGILYTTNGGGSWNETGPAPTGPLRAVWFHDAWNGVAAGPFGTVYRTTDGGGTWACVRGQPRRAGLLVVEPFGGVGDWPLVSMLCGDRGHRTILWWITTPTGRDLRTAERQLREAAWSLGGADAMILGPTPSARIDGPPGFGAPTSALPQAPLSAADPAETVALIRGTVSRWRPTVVLSPSKDSDNAEQAFVGGAVDAATEDTNVIRWTADPANDTGARLPGAASDFEVSLSPLTVSEESPVYHGIAAQRAARLVRRWPAPVAESLGYHRPGAEGRDPHPVALLGDLQRGDAETCRDIGATARVPLSRRLAWEKEAAKFYSQLKGDLAMGSFADALGRASDFYQTQPQLQLSRSCLAEIVARAAAMGDPDTAALAAALITALPAFGQQHAPWTIDGLLWRIDWTCSLERRLGPADASTAPAPPEATEKLLQMLRSWAPVLATRPDIEYQRLRTSAMDEPSYRAALRRVAERLTPADYPVLAKLVDLDRWLTDGRKGEPPVPVVRLLPANADDVEKKDLTKEIAIGGALRLQFTGKGRLLVVTLDSREAGAWWLTVDADRDGRTVLAEPLADDQPPESAAIATAAAPVWVRRPALWRRELQGDRLALALDLEQFGGRPKPGAVWFLTLRHPPAPGVRPMVGQALGHGGCFAISFE